MNREIFRKKQKICSTIHVELEFNFTSSRVEAFLNSVAVFVKDHVKAKSLDLVKLS